MKRKFYFLAGMHVNRLSKDNSVAVDLKKKMRNRQELQGVSSAELLAYVLHIISHTNSTILSFVLSKMQCNGENTYTGRCHEF